MLVVGSAGGLRRVSRAFCVSEGATGPNYSVLGRW